MFTCVVCRRHQIGLEDALHQLAQLCVCLRCVTESAEGGITISAENAQSLMKQAIRTWPRGDGPLPERVSNEAAQHLAGGECALCRFPTEADDAVLRGSGGRVICLRCYERETGSERPMPKKLRESIQAVLAAAEG